MHDVVTSFDASPAPLLPTLPAFPGLPYTSLESAVTAAALATAHYLYPSHAAALQNAGDIAKLLFTGTPAQIATGETYGKAVAQAWINDRMFDGSSAPAMVPGSLANPAPLDHRPDPHSPGQTLFDRDWGKVRPFTLAAAQDANLCHFPAPGSADHVASFKQVKKFGRIDIPLRRPDLATDGVFWAYDGAQKLGTPPRLYNQIVRSLPATQCNTVLEDARLFALINIGMADAGISAWYWKYVYDLWRPVVGIRETPLTDGGDPFWCPLGAPQTNLPEARNVPSVKNVTPNFPAYPSGHATFATACFVLVARFYDKPLTDDSLKLKFISDELNGGNRDNTDTFRPTVEKEFDLLQAIIANGLSRVWLGVHWDFDAIGGIGVGYQVAKVAAQKFGITNFPSDDAELNAILDPIKHHATLSCSE